MLRLVEKAREIGMGRSLKELAVRFHVVAMGTIQGKEWIRIKMLGEGNPEVRLFCDTETIRQLYQYFHYADRD